MVNIEIMYWILFSLIAIVGILTITRKMSFGIGIIGFITGFLIVYFLTPYTNIVMIQVSNALFHGGTFTLTVILAIIHLILLAVLVMEMTYNLMSSGGKIAWA